MLIPINEIQVGKRLRALRENAVEQLMESIGKIGLQTPISVATKSPGFGTRISYHLIAGAHRLEACKRLGWGEIEVRMGPIYESEIWEIDENLCRAELTELERGEHLARRKELYESLHPETRHGANRQPSGQFGHTEIPRFSEDTSGKVGLSDTVIRRAIRRVDKIDKRVRDRIRQNPNIADSRVELDALASLDKDHQKKAVKLVEKGAVTTIRETKAQLAPLEKPTPSPPTLLVSGRFSWLARRQFENTDPALWDRLDTALIDEVREIRRGLKPGSAAGPPQMSKEAQIRALREQGAGQ